MDYDDIYQLKRSKNHDEVSRAVFDSSLPQSMVIKLLLDEEVRYEVKTYLLENIMDQEILNRIILHPQIWTNLKLEVAPRISNDKVLVNVLEESDDFELRYFVVQFISTEDTLFSLVRGDYHLDVRYQALEQYLKQGSQLNQLREISEDITIPPSLRALAISEIKDQDLLKDYYDKFDDKLIRASIIANLTDQSFLKQEFSHVKDGELKVEIAKSLNDRELALDIIFSHHHENDRLGALLFVDDPEVYQKVAFESTSQYLRYYAISNIKQEEILRDIAMEYEETPEIVRLAMQGISDKKLLQSLLLVDGTRPLAKEKLYRLQ